ncbi:MAG TPA: 6-carboxytetrahydropterin synthase [Planctomycetota bacterium]|nr:6-carboxytetrahydropterin synthase [Planctomycetota bacterium]
MSGIFEVSIQTHFCAAHALRDYKGATEPTHGHNFHVTVTVFGERLDKAGIVVDFLDLKPLIDEEIRRLDYGFLNETVDEFKLSGGKLSPSAENIAFVLFQRLKKRLPPSVKMSSVQVGESPGCFATYRERE